MIRCFFVIIGRFLQLLNFKSWTSTLKSCTNYIRTGYNAYHCVKLGKRTVLHKGARIINPQFISIGSNCSIDRYTTIEAPFMKNIQTSVTIELGDGVTIGEFCHITGINKVVIKDNVLTGKYVTITDNAHGNLTKEGCLIHPSKREVISKGPVIIEDCVWIGDKVTILPGVTIGRGSIIGANAVVCSDIPPFSVAAGVPARVKKQIQ